MIENMTDEMWKDYYSFTNNQFTKKYNLTNNDMARLVNEMKEQGKVLKHSLMKSNCCIKEDTKSKKFTVSITIFKEKLFFGNYDSYDEARKISDSLIQANWNIHLLSKKEQDIIYNSLSKDQRCIPHSLEWDNQRKRFNVIVYEKNKGFRYTIEDAI